LNEFTYSISEIPEVLDRNLYDNIQGFRRLTRHYVYRACLKNVTTARKKKNTQEHTNTIVEQALAFALVDLTMCF
jgi:hypothetical protein